LLAPACRTVHTTLRSDWAFDWVLKCITEAEPKKNKRRTGVHTISHNHECSACPQHGSKSARKFFSSRLWSVDMWHACRFGIPLLADSASIIQTPSRYDQSACPSTYNFLICCLEKKNLHATQSRTITHLLIGYNLHILSFSTRVLDLETELINFK
jgi:hypothetical protein